MRAAFVITLAALLLSFPIQAQELERVNNANVLMRSAAFATDIGPGVIYTLVELQPGRWAAYAQRGQLGEGTWAVEASPMSGPRAGYVTFINSKKEKLTLDVLQVDSCYGFSGDVRIGW